MVFSYINLHDCIIFAKKKAILIEHFMPSLIENACVLLLIYEHDVRRTNYIIRKGNYLN